MAMKNPEHPGKLIAANLDELEVSVADAAGHLGVTRQQLYKVIKGEAAVSPVMAVRLEKAFGGSGEMWLRMQANYDLAQVRKGSIKVKKLEPA
jgi:addiction module HigA family antidote